MSRRSDLAPYLIALLLAVIVIAGLFQMTMEATTQIQRWVDRDTYPTELTAGARLRFGLARFWGEFWWLGAPWIVVIAVGSVALYKIFSLGGWPTHRLRSGTR